MPNLKKGFKWNFNTSYVDLTNPDKTGISNFTITVTSSTVLPDTYSIFDGNNIVSNFSQQAAVLTCKITYPDKSSETIDLSGIFKTGNKFEAYGLFHSLNKDKLIFDIVSLNKIESARMQFIHSNGSFSAISGYNLPI